MIIIIMKMKLITLSNSLISRLSTVKNKAIDVGTKAFSMVSEVAINHLIIKKRKMKN